MNVVCANKLNLATLLQSFRDITGLQGSPNVWPKSTLAPRTKPQNRQGMVGYNRHPCDEKVIAVAAKEAVHLVTTGTQNRHVAATKANADSSRSHCVFSCVLERKCTEDGVTSIRTSCLKLVDLAGEHGLSHW